MQAVAKPAVSCDTVSRQGCEELCPIAPSVCRSLGERFGDGLLDYHVQPRPEGGERARRLGHVLAQHALGGRALEGRNPGEHLV